MHTYFKINSNRMAGIVQISNQMQPQTQRMHAITDRTGDSHSKQDLRVISKTKPHIEFMNNMLPSVVTSTAVHLKEFSKWRGSTQHLLYVSAPVEDTHHDRLQAGDVAQEELSLELCLLQHKLFLFRLQRSKGGPQWTPNNIQLKQNLDEFCTYRYTIYI